MWFNVSCLSFLSSSPLHPSQPALVSPKSLSLPCCQKGKEGKSSCHTEKKRIICWLKILHVSTNPKCLSYTKLVRRPRNGRNGGVCVCMLESESNKYLNPTIMKICWWFHTSCPKTDQWHTRSPSSQSVGRSNQRKVQQEGSEVARGHEKEGGRGGGEFAPTEPL